MRAESSMPRWQIHVISRIHRMQPTSPAPVCASAQCHSKSWNVYSAAISPREAITSTSARNTAQPFTHPTVGPKARVVHANEVPASGSALFR